MRADPMPLYHRIYLALRERIQRSEFDPDVPMPSELELSRAYSVSRVTLRRTLERLEQEGLILRQRGRGTFARPPSQAGAVRADVSGLVENLIAMGLSTDVEVLEFGYAPLPLDIAVEMGEPPATMAQRAVRLRSLKGTPFSHATTWVREDIGRSFNAEDLARTPLLRLFEMAGVEIAGAAQRVTASAADYAVAGHLGVDVGTPLLAIRRVVKDSAGRAVEHIHALYRPDMYAFELNLTLGEGPDGTLWRATPRAL